MAEFAYLIEIAHPGRNVRLTTARRDVRWRGPAWTGCGPGVKVRTRDDTPDQRLILSLSRRTRRRLPTAELDGRKARISLARVDARAGLILRDPYEVFRGTVRTRRITWLGTLHLEVVSRLAELSRTRPFRANEESHRAALRRAGLDEDDLFFAERPEPVVGVESWGRPSG